MGNCLNCRHWQEREPDHKGYVDPDEPSECNKLGKEGDFYPAISFYVGDERIKPTVITSPRFGCDFFEKRNY